MIEPKGPSQEAIAQRAYELYVERGGEPGRELEDWLAAEKELSGGVVAEPARTKAAQAGRGPN